MCYWPTLIRNRHYIANKKNGGVIPAISDERQLYTPIGCGECEECRKQRQNGWITRMMEEIRTNEHGKVITLTFSNEWYTKLREEVLREGNKELRKIRKNRRMKIVDKEKERRKIENRMTGYALDNEIATIATRKFLERWRYRYGSSWWF